MRPPPEALYAKEIAARLGVAISTVHSYRSRGQMPPPDGRDVHGHPWWLPRTLVLWRSEFLGDVLGEV